MVMREQISGLMDGELEGAEADDAFRELRNADGVATWACYHVIGDTLRQCGSATAPRFSERFAARLAAEPTVLAPRRQPGRKLPFAWAAAATVAAVLVVGWVAVSTLDPQPTVLAAVGAASVVRAPATPQPVEPDYLLAHQEYSPTTQIQGLGPYLRAVSAGTADGRP
jgi:sigma-E factor negative regulatory protein RseA